MSKFDISKFAKTVVPAAESPRDIEIITKEILDLKQDAGNAILALGDRLNEAKAQLSHGEWLSWLTERVEFSESTAQRFMRLAREWRNPSALTDLGATKALTLLALPPEERESFMAENHLVNGEEKNVIDMTSRELEKAIRERDEAKREAEAARADAQTAEESRAKMEADMETLKQIHQAAQEGEAQALEALAEARRELQDLRDRPADVAVETVVDQEAVVKAREEAIAEMSSKVQAAEQAKKNAEAARKKAEDALKDAQKKAQDNADAISRAEKAEAELAEARRQLEAAARTEKQAVVNQNGELAMFNVLFGQIQEQVNKMHGLRIKLGKDDEALDGKLKAALSALADAVRRCAE